ncbi:hypothetical protein SAMN04488004_103241 [Loktanella salsilacus]|uniref:AAA domain-containing protein n=2 Tax=Loktanella salsilacus TaxID=195913 RepID=A0A1I4D584_9RHOB|nr:hypothetical protein SAMN04488004_103241 [Loktanella salsilacus]
MSKTHPACMAMTSWTLEDWTPPGAFERFPLLEICPDAPTYFAQAGHFTARDLRTIVTMLNLDTDHRDAEKIYRFILERSEKAPWIFPVLEASVADKRTTNGGSKSRRKKKAPLVLSKMPLMKLRLRQNTHLHDRTAELLSQTVQADVAVGAFCEYAIAFYHQRIEETDPNQVFLEAKAILTYASSDEALAGELGDLKKVNDWEGHAGLILDLARDYPEAASDKLHVHSLETLRRLAQEITLTTEKHIFQQISALAYICSQQVELLSVPRRDAVLLQVSKLGLKHSPDQIDDDMIATLSLALDEGLASRMRTQAVEIAELEESVIEFKEKIQAAGQDEDYSLLAELAQKANSGKEALSAARAARSDLVSCLEGLLSGEIQDHYVSLDRILRHIADVADEQEDPADASVVLTAGLFDVASKVSATADAEDECEELDSGEAVEPAASDLPGISAEQSYADEAADYSVVYPLVESDTETSAAINTDFVDHSRAANAETNDNFESDLIAEHIAILETDSDEILLCLDDEAPRSDELVVGDDDDADPETNIGIQAASAPQVDQPLIDTAPTVDPEVLADLIDRDLLGVAADAAESFEAHGRAWPIAAVVLKAAAGSRGPHREYDLDTQRFLTLANRATGNASSDLGSVLLLGALIRPSILEKSAAGLRSSLSGLCRGSLGQHLQQATDAITKLDYDFPPDADELARLAGTQRVPQKQRIATQLGQWADTVAAKTSRWPFATGVLHHIASEAGPIGAARAAIDAGGEDAPKLARQAIDALSSNSAIGTVSVDYASAMGKTSTQLHPKGLEYLERQFDEPLGLLDSWLRAAAREGTYGQQSEARLRTTIGNLTSRLEKAYAGLAQDAELSSDPLTSAVSRWIGSQVNEALKALRGEDTGSFATLEEALTAERDLLPSAVRDAMEAPEQRFDAFRDMLVTDALRDPAGALLRARDEGAFETAMRLATRFGIDDREAITRDMIAFAKTWEAEITSRSRRLKTLSKVDYKHQDEISRRLSWCEIALTRLAAIKDRSEIHDLADLPAATAELDTISSVIEDKIREDQVERIGQYRNERNAEEADALLVGLKGVTVEATEDRIAQLRDGRSAATFQTELGGIISDFVPDFLAYATTVGWPHTDDAYQEAVLSEGPLYIEEDRRAVGLAFIKLYRAIAASAETRQPDVPKIRALFEDIGYDSVKIHNFQPLGRTGVWQGRITGAIRSVLTDDWFLPPIFGSQANAGTRFLLVGPDALPENIVKALSSDTPSIILCAGIVDAARRHELAERLRANAIPALLIDEALIAFTATRRQTRARTVFECGLPYGRIEPYTTDAGQLPPEMFFGRGEEIRLIMSKTADGCLVYGGRQLGKSALLGHIARIQHAPEHNRIVINREVRSLGNSETTSEIWAHLASMLSPDVVKAGSRTAEDVSRDIRAWLMHKPQGRIVAMFDEADNFMDADTKDDYPELARLKKLMEDTGRAFKVVFAGLHNVQRMHRQPNSPLAHLGQPICIGPLNRTEDDKRAAHDLVVTPMRSAGFRFETPEAVEEILAWANYYPSLVQEYMKGLLSTLHGTGTGKTYKLDGDGPLWPISSETLFSHRGFGHIESRIRYKFHLTLGLDPRYALVAYTLGRLNVEGQEDKARVTGFEPRELLDEARIFWPRSSESPSLAAFEALLEELFDLGVLGRVPIPHTKRYRYLLGSRQVATMLGSEADIYHALSEIEEKDPAVAYDRAIHRRRYTTGVVSDQSEWHYCPLTDLQIERIVQPEDAPVQIVCGLEALGISKVGSSLKRIASSGHLPGAPDQGISVEIVRNTRELRAQVDRKVGSGLTSIVVFTPETPKEAHDSIVWLERQPRVLGKQIRPLILLDAAETEMRDVATRRREQSQFLSAWGAEMVRVHLHHIEKVELDTRPLREAILSSTGGIPSETINLIAAMRIAAAPMEEARGWKATLRVPAGLLKGALGKALVLLDMADNEDYQALNELVLEYSGSDLTDLGPDFVATGLVSIWQPKSGRIRRSALGDLLSIQIQS